MRNSLFDLWPYDEATLFDLVLYDYDKQRAWTNYRTWR
jgi:hypothetical protein